MNRDNVIMPAASTILFKKLPLILMVLALIYQPAAISTQDANSETGESRSVSKHTYTSILTYRKPNKGLNDTTSSIYSSSSYSNSVLPTLESFSTPAPNSFSKLLSTNISTPIEKSVQTGSKTCNCNPIGSNSSICDPISGQCECKTANITGINCDKCKLNHYDISSGCLECDTCYQIVELGVDYYKGQLKDLTDMVNEIENNPDLIKDSRFANALLDLMNRVRNMLRDAEKAHNMEQKLVIQFKDLTERLAKINKSADNVEAHLNFSKPSLEQASANITIAEGLLKKIQDQLASAEKYILNEGNDALLKAKKRADLLGQQSRKVTEIAKESRQLADQHTLDAEKTRNLTDQALQVTNLAYELAKNASAIQEANQRNIQQIKQQIDKIAAQLSKTQRISAESAAEAKRSYDEALALYTNINSLQIAKADIPRLRSRALELLRNAQRLKGEIQEFIARHTDLLAKTQFKLNEMRDLIDEARRQQQITDKQLVDIDKSMAVAKAAIKRADKILKEAQYTLDTLQKFDQMVEESRRNALEALKKIPEIRKTIKAAEEKTKDAAAKLDRALADATEARDVALQAFGLANETSVDVRKIRIDAHELKNRLLTLKAQVDKLGENMNSTSLSLDQYEQVAAADGDMAKLMLEKANQAAAFARNATETARKLLDIINPLLKSIDAIGGIDINKLGQLEESLAKLKQKMDDSNLVQLIKDLLEQKALQEQLMKEYQDLIEWLRKEVANIREIRDSLPDKCFRRLRLEPPLIENRKK